MNLIISNKCSSIIYPSYARERNTTHKVKNKYRELKNNKERIENLELTFLTEEQSHAPGEKKPEQEIEIKQLLNNFWTRGAQPVPIQPSQNLNFKFLFFLSMTEIIRKTTSIVLSYSEVSLLLLP